MLYDYIKFFLNRKIILIALGLFFNSCVYFNTFYNAKDSFNKAIEIIDNDSSKNYQQNQTLSNLAKNLLNESISSSSIVIQKYPESKYVDDAIYYMGRSYFSLQEIYKSKKYFNELINSYPNSEYYNESRLWLEYSYLKLNLLDSSIKNITLIEKDFINNSEEIDDNLFYLLYNLKGDFFIQLDQYDQALIEFEKALKFIPSKTKKIMMYSKISIISESYKRFDKAINYLEKIQIVSNDKDIKIEAFRKWLDIMKKMQLYDEIIIKIQEKLISPDFDSNNLIDELNIELAISYMKKNNFSESKNIFNKIIEITNQKKNKAQAYYWLGYISLMNEFELDLSLEYFNLVNETMRSSKYSKQVRNYISDIDSYNALLEEYNFLLSSKEDEIVVQENLNQYNIHSNNDIQNDIATKDSLLFIIAEKLFFDFNQKDLSIKKHNELIQTYPNSIYSDRSKKIVNQLINQITFDNFSLDSLALLRDSAWEQFYEFYPHNFNLANNTIDIFKEIAINYDDFYSYYSLGFIYENYFYDPFLSIEYYLESLKLCRDNKIKNEIKNKMLLIENDLNNENSILNKKINYLKAIEFLTKESNIDSTVIYLNNNYDSKNKSPKNEIELQSKILHDFIINNKDSLNNFNFYISNDSLIFKNTNSIDSVNYITFYFYKNKDFSLYTKKINKNKSLLTLFQDSILHSNFIDTLEVKNDNHQNKMPNINNNIIPNFD